MSGDQFPLGSRWILPDGRRVQVTRSPYWLDKHSVTLFVENRRRGGRRETTFRADRLALIARPFEPQPWIAEPATSRYQRGIDDFADRAKVEESQP